MTDTTNEGEITSIKGFGLDWKCRGFQYEIGQTYEHTGKVDACESGFHAIEGHPLEVFNYYVPGQSRYAEVRQSGALSRHGSDSKVASARISIVAEITMPDLISRAVKWVMDRATPEGGHATGDQGAASATGPRGAASATGPQGAASATGYQGAASATGPLGAASATGDQGAASATGPRGAAMSSGYDGRVLGADGCALFLARRNDEGKITHVWSGIAGKSGIKPNVWYRLNGHGKPVEVAS